ncbi:MAG: 5-formyltetrahydrofolate cyclo-ligase [Rhodobacteraceae bacterium]|nr:MAG: 5-formyltetrahydrofolate cyclo-ligase [Paracoccaceae bacterium]
METLAERKKTLRAEAAARRAAAFEALGPRPAGACERLLEAVVAHRPRVVSAYRPFRSEIDPTPALEALIARGVTVAAPVVVAKATPLVFRRWAPGDPVDRDGFGVETPRGGEEVTPDVVIAPLLLFDRAGYRLGYGGGFYDRTLERLRAAGPCVAIGFAFAAQETGAAPRDPHDARLDLIVTERETIRPEDRP